MNLIKLGNILKNRRLELKLSLRKAAELIGISHNYLSIIEKAHDPRSNAPIKPTFETLKLISEAYEMNINKLLVLAGYHEYIKSVEEIYTAQELSKLVPEEYREAFRKLNMKQIRFVKKMVDEDIDLEILGNVIEKLKELKISLDRLEVKDKKDYK
ncbi:helix-turn-helix domain-containing protein [Paramaledivibacter caminithermalis]|jgi:transcriptional regulator with XRE-family HTH domain|uniref:Helix-turn-helix n=1 Tax=Paramaledivibacter caminithermalis (strain DSM 15212 / CIP 107654 / DViRD3) TaxID=1121301 RepID=A0A1M6LHX1_PARC5|nr:helix-turn-helix transcriptional regulator [Paramaledivibacter caminithermalis]SHJ70784.1 Helix-turn-helix [Paramaledivibacter caminithermalis DSM 15212]